MVSVRQTYSTAAQTANTGWHTLASGTKKGLYFVCWNKPQNTWGRYGAQTTRVLGVLYIAQTIASLGLFWFVYSQCDANKMSLKEAKIKSGNCLIPGWFLYQLIK